MKTRSNTTPTRKIAFVLFLVIALWVSTNRNTFGVSAGSVANTNSPLGTNLHVLSDWSSEYAFVDAFKASRPWITQNDTTWDTDEADLLDLDADGWVRSLPTAGASASYRYASTVMFNDINGNYPSGQYIVLYDGEGTIEYGYDAVKNTTQSTAGRDVLDVTAGATHLGIFLKITETDPNNTSDYIRNIRVLMPGFNETNYESQTFHPDFLNSVEKFKLIRFMDWMRTNWDHNGPITAGLNMRQPKAEAYSLRTNTDDNPFTRNSNFNNPLPWADRSEAADARYSTDLGVPVEVMVELANTTKADAWFNMPHQANDQYITEFATFVRDNLNNGQYVYVEYSNEVWNGTFGQGSWVEQQAQLMWPNSNANAFTKRLNYFGVRSAQMCDIWENVFGADSDRVVCVIATQAANSWIGEQMLDCPLWSEGPCHEHNVDAVAIAPYFGQHIGHDSYKAQVESWGVNGTNQLFDELINGDVLPNNISKTTVSGSMLNMDSYATVANNRNLSMIAYEGGQHLAGLGAAQWSNTITTLFGNANKDSRMADAYTDYLNHWNSIGGEMFVHFNNTGMYGPYGNWGSQVAYSDNNAPKQDAIQNFIDANACSWDSCTPSAPAATPTVSIPNAAPDPFGVRTLPVSIATNGTAISAVEFSLEFDPFQMEVNTADANNDGLLDAVSLEMPSGFVATASLDEGFTRHILTISIAATGAQTLTDGVIANIDLTVHGAGNGLELLTTPYDNSGNLIQPIICTNGNGVTVACAFTGLAFTNTPTSVTMSGQQVQAAGTGINLLVIAMIGLALTVLGVGVAKRN